MMDRPGAGRERQVEKAETFAPGARLSSPEVTGCTPKPGSWAAGDHRVTQQPRAIEQQL